MLTEVLRHLLTDRDVDLVKIADAQRNDKIQWSEGRLGRSYIDVY